MDFDEPGLMSRPDFVKFLNSGRRASVAVRFHRNRVSMISVAFAADGSAELRVHEAFLGAGPDVLAALKLYLNTRRSKAWRTVVGFANGIRVPALGRRVLKPLNAAGRVHDLGEISSDVSRTFFNGRVKCRVGWGRLGRTKRRRRAASIRYGSWDESTRTVRVNPRLDDERVPREFVRYIVFHEMLHAVVPVEVQAGRRLTHTRQFRALEKGFPNLGKMVKLCDRLWSIV